MRQDSARARVETWATSARLYGAAVLARAHQIRRSKLYRSPTRRGWDNAAWLCFQGAYLKIRTAILGYSRLYSMHV